MSIELAPRAGVRVAIAESPVAGQSTNGDRAIAIPADDGALLAVVDGLGHGPAAGEAAAAAIDAIARNADLPLDEIVRRCHEEIRRTRGVVLALARWDDATSRLHWTSIGNVEALVARNGRASERPARRGGTVGVQLPTRMPVRTVELERDDVLMMATDGIRHGFVVESGRRRGLRSIAEHVMQRHRRRSDDALVLVARFDVDAEASR